MMLTVLAGGAALGLVSAPHCLAMCGPLAIAGCTRSGDVCAPDAASYLGARVVAYAAMGAVMGLFGASAMHGRGITLGRVAVVLLAATCVWQGVRSMRPVRNDAAGLIPLRAGPQPLTWVSTLSALLPRRGAGLGVVTAILPCGALFAAWGYAAATAHPVTGALAMVAFAVASAPGLLLALAGRRLGSKVLQRTPRWLVAAAWLAVALLLVARLYISMKGTSDGCHG